MNYAFDFYGTLWKDRTGVNQEIFKLAQDLIDAGYEVGVISHVPNERQAHVTERKIDDLGLDFAYKRVGTFGNNKAPIMMQVGADCIIDDTPAVCQNARDNGLLAINAKRIE